MAYNNHPFWDFVRNLDAQQQGYENPAAARQEQEPGTAQEPAEPYQAQFDGPFAAFAPFFVAPQHPRFGGRGQGRRCGGYRRGECPAMNPDGAPSAARGAEESEGEQHGPQFGRHGRGHRGFHGRRGGWAHGGGHRGPSPYSAFGGPNGAAFDLSALINSISSHPIAEALRTYVDETTRAAAAGNTDPNTAPNESAETLVNKDNEETDTFSPAVDTFSTPASYVLHVALPGAQKEDVGVNWDAEKGELNIAGVVYRAGDEKFIESLKKKERRVGMFERSVKLPLEGEDKVEVDSDNISAKLEDGVLVITIGKVAKEETWTDLKRVDIQ